MPQNWRFIPRSAPPGAPPASALYQVSAYGCAVTVSVSAASATAPPTTPIATRSMNSDFTNACANATAVRAAHTAPTPAAMQIVGSAGIQCFSAPKIGVEPRKNGPIDAPADSTSSSAGARSRSIVPRLAIHTPAPVTAAASVATGTVNSVVTSATCHGNGGAL